MQVRDTGNIHRCRGSGTGNIHRCRDRGTGNIHRCRLEVQVTYTGAG